MYGTVLAICISGDARVEFVSRAETLIDHRNACQYYAAHTR